jgi:cytochrome c biogenesis protein CcmG/thiol:disulfide interchange protein DsbE
LALSDLEGKVVVLNFWASWCVACIDEHQVFVAAERFYADQDLQMLGVVYQDSPENARRWMTRMGGGWPSVIDDNSRIAIDYGVYGVPETYFIARDGRIAHKQIGPVSWPLLTALVDRLLAESASDDLAIGDAATGDIPTGRSEGHVQGDRGTAEKETGR